MRRLLILLFMISVMTIPVCADRWVAPEAPSEVRQYLPEETGSFEEDLWFVITSALNTLQDRGFAYRRSSLPYKFAEPHLP